MKITSTVKHRQTTFLLEDYLHLISLNEIEKKIVDERVYDNEGIFKMELSTTKTALFKIVVGISHISGGELPKTEALLDMFIDELHTFILEYGYDAYAIQEILLAFRFNINTKLRQPSGITIDRVELKTQNLSIEYISDVLRCYSVLRDSIDRKFQNHVDGY